MLSLLPPEIVAHIIAFACTDGGPTAAALLRCSRSVSAITLPHRFQTVAIAGFVQITRFVEAYRAAIQRDPTVRVQRLFVSDVTQTQEAKAASDELGDRHYRRPVFPVLPVDRPHIHLLVNVLSCVGPGVRELAVVLQDAWHLYRFVMGAVITELPALEELDIACTVRPRQFIYKKWPSMPRLRTLRMSLRGAPLRELASKVDGIKFAAPVHLVLRDFATGLMVSNIDAPATVSLLGAASRLAGEAGSVVERLTLWPDGPIPEMEEAQAKYGDRLVIMPADPHRRTWAEFKAAFL
jgi:hypothetical protein